SGTENVAGAVGLATALELADAERSSRAEHVGALTARFITRVLELLPHAALTGDPASRLPGVASFTLAGVSGESVLLELERRGVISSSGSACAAGSDEPSHVLLACGIAPEIAQTSVRFTFGADVDTEALLAAAASVGESVAAVTAL